MSESSKKTLPWVKLPMTKKPNFVFRKIKFTIPTKVPSSLIYFAIYLGIFYVYIGGVYDLVENPLAFGGGEGGAPVLIFPSTDRQFLIEGVVVGLLMLLGSLSLYLFYEATTDPHDIERANKYQIFGVLLLLLVVYAISAIYGCKADPASCQ